MDDVFVVTVDPGVRSDTIQNVLKVPPDVSWPDFELLMQLTFNFEHLTIKYLDEENDEITISSENELREAFKVARQQHNSLHLKLRDPRSPVSDPPATVSSPPPTVTWTTTPKDACSGSAVSATPSAAASTSSAPMAMDVQTEAPVAKTELDPETGAASAPRELLKESSSSDESATMELTTQSSKESSSSPDSGPPVPRYFWLRHLASQLVLDVEGWNSAPGTRVILWTPKYGSGLQGNDNQLFYEDKETGTIRSKFCGLCLDAGGTFLRPWNATMQPYREGQGSQMWKIVENRIQHGVPHSPIVIGVNDEVANPRKWVEAMNYTGSLHQQWAVDYVVNPQLKALGENHSLRMMAPDLKNFSSPNKERKKEYYTRLAQEISRGRARMKMAGRRSNRDVCSELERKTVAETTGPGTNVDEPQPRPPRWFTIYMEKFKREICEEISTLVTCKTVRQVLCGLEGVVLASSASQTPGGATSAPSSSGQEEQLQEVYRHYGIICDHCDHIIIGIRYKCGNCEDYDLCEPCEAKVGSEGLHDPKHVFIKIRRPALAVARRKNGKPAPLLKRSLYTTEGDIQKLQEKMLRKQEKQRRREEKLDERMKRRDDKLKRRHELYKESPSKKEKLDIPQCGTIVRMDAEFLTDDNFPDGSLVAPQTHFIKRWVIKNTGQQPWDSNTKLILIWGNINVVDPEVAVPPTQPEDTAVISVELISPSEPGMYQSHWRMSQGGARFGHRVWCNITVEGNDSDSSAFTSVIPLPGALREGEIKVEQPDASVTEGPRVDVKEVKDACDTALLTAQDILSFEMLDIRDRNTPKVSQTATPTNTPLALTPPKSPVHETEEHGLRHMSTSSSVEIVSEPSSEDSTSHMTELVQERIAMLGLKPDPVVGQVDDIETISSCSDDSNNSDSDFYIVPLPDCFNPELPLTASTSSVLVTREEVQKSVGEASRNMETFTYVGPDVIDLTGEPDEFSETDQFTGHCDLSVADAEEPRAAHPEPPQVNSSNRDPSPVEGYVTDENANSVELTPEEVKVVPDDPTTDVTASSPPPPAEGAPSVPVAESPLEGATGGAAVEEGLEQCQDVAGDSSKGLGEGPSEISRSPPQTPPSPGVLASSLMTAAIGVATHAAATAYTTAKDVFHTLQANNQYVPPKSNWKPSNQGWTPPKQEWTPPTTQAWTPPNQEWTPPTQDWTPPDPPVDLLRGVVVAPTAPAPPAPLTPIDQLVEMGFANRELNRELLETHDGDLQKVVQELVTVSNNDWHETRH